MKIIIPEIKISIQYKNPVQQAEFFTVTSSKDCEEVLRTLFEPSTFLWIEEMVLLCLNRNNKVIGFYKLSIGGTTGTFCDPKVIFTIALNCGASGIILAHNHPSGSLRASTADISTTKRIKKVGESLDITLIEHIILTQDSYYSFADNGNL